MNVLHGSFGFHGGKSIFLNWVALCGLAFMCILIVSCGKKSSAFTPEERKAAGDLVQSTHGIDSLAMLQKQLEADGNKLGSVIALREWGKTLRNESRFDEALSIHSEGLRQAEALNDTLEWVQALNNIGTDYRRMGLLDMAQEYHYNAWKLSEECADTSFVARKNRVVSLNGLGNIYMTLGNYERADSALRMALDGERQLNSALGLAINYANLGAIFEHRGQIDSAWVCYRNSMAFNTKAGSTLGISLCHTYFGSLYEKQQQYDLATREFESAYRLMWSSKDKWHALNSLIALAGIFNATHDDAKALDYLGKAKQEAESIRSKEHLADIYLLYYKHYKRQGDFHTALSFYEQANAMKDSVLDMEKVNRIQNTSLAIERNHQTRIANTAKLKLEQERTARHTGYAIFSFVLVVLVGILATFLYIQRILRRNHLALKRLSTLRENFFTNITHEFRNPLTVILGASQRLESGKLVPGEDPQRLYSMINRQGSSLLNLINQLLDISKIKSEIGNPDWRNGNVVPFVRMIVESYQDFASQKYAGISFAPKENSIEMDFVPEYMKKMLSNLLSNALKFTPKHGNIYVTLNKQGSDLRLCVADTGQGIPEEEMPHIFEAFYQGSASNSEIGTGVGLPLVKHIVSAMRGEIKVHSHEGRGTVFTILLPLEQPNNKSFKAFVMNEDQIPIVDEHVMGNDNESLPVGKVECDSVNRSPLVLIVEDDQDVAYYIGAHLQQQYTLRYARNGKQGYDMAHEIMPDLIVTDLMMPECDGCKLCSMIRANEALNHIPIIILSAKEDNADRIKGIQAGADIYMVKPFTADLLRANVVHLIEQRRALRQKYAQAMAQEESEEVQMTKFDHEFLSKFVNLVHASMKSGKLDVDDLASGMCMTTRQLRYKITALTGESPNTYILQIRLNKARRLLQSSEESIGDIAMKCGFEDSAYFSRAFKQMFQVTPTQFRREQ